jgi:hypothetical protein
MFFELPARLDRPSSPSGLWQQFIGLSWPVLKPSWELIFLHIFAIPVSSRHGNFRSNTREHTVRVLICQRVGGCTNSVVYCTDKSFSEALILASTNPQYDKRLFIELPVQHMKTTSAEHGKNMFCACSFHVLNW